MNQMNKIVDMCLTDEIELERTLVKWINGISLSDSENDKRLLSSFSELNIQDFSDQFAYSVHSSFDWLLKQALSTPLNRSIKPPIILRENKISLNINDRELFPSLDEADKLQNQPNNILKKRIKPTLVSQNRLPLNENKWNEKGIVKNAANCENEKAKSSDFFKEEREMLKNFKLNIANSSIPDKDSSKSKSIEATKNHCVIEPKYELVTYNKEIIKLKDFYLNLILSNHISNFFDEIRFILEILNKKTILESISKVDDRIQTTIEKIFSLYHNCFYFAYLLFEDIFINNLVVNFLDYKALNQIFGNFYLLNFRRDHDLRELVEQSYLGRNISESTTPKTNNYENNFVYFQPDTDSKANFPNDFSFSIFRKQRDEFYRIFKNYEENNFASSLSTDRKGQNHFFSNIRAMLSLSKDVGNYYHLARLFASQLVKSCNCDFNSDPSKSFNPAKSTSTNQANKIILTEQDKLRRLQDRFVKKAPQNEMHLTVNLLEESFSQREKFFRDFIYYSDSHSFNEQLKLILKNQIIELTTCDIFQTLEDSLGDDDGDKNLLAHMSKLNLLAKFLGFLCFYPLDTSISVNKMSSKSDFLDQQKALRSKSDNQLPILDIETYLANSMEKHVLIVAVPWVVEFLIFIDQITLSTSYYENVLSLLALIYKYYLPNLTSITIQLNSQTSYTRLFIQLFLEKLFAIKKFNAFARLHSLAENTRGTADNVSNEMFRNIKSAKSCLNLEEVYLDFHNEIFDFDLIHTFFPQFTKLIVDQFKQFSANEVRKKITPLFLGSNNSTSVDSSTGYNSTCATSKTILVRNTEACFLNIHPSLKKTVLFLNDIISANINKKIKCELYPKAKTKHFENFLLQNPELNTEASLEDKNIKSIKKYAELAIELRNECKNFVPDYAKDKIQTIFPLIIVDAFDESVINFAIKICLRHIEHRCNSWVELNITTETVLTEFSNFRMENARMRNSACTQTKSDKVIESHETISHSFVNYEMVIYQLREMLYNVNHGNFDQAESCIFGTLLGKIASARKLTYLPSSNLKLFDATLLDIVISIIAFAPQLMNDDLLDSLIQFWKAQKIIYSRVICAKNLHLINKSKSRISTWLKFELLLTRMLKSGVITFEDIDESAFAVVSKQEWPQNMLLNLANLTQSLVECAKQYNLFEENGQSELLEWLSWFCMQKDV